MIVALEGIDGAGKNTLVAALRDALGGARSGEDVPGGFQAVHTLSFPCYDTSIHAQLASSALHGDMGDLADSAHGMATLFALDRYGQRECLEHYSARADELLLLDRYVASNAAYTSARTGNVADRAWVAELEFGRLGLPRPDLQVLVDASPDVARERAQRREALDASRTRDRYERDAALQDATFAAYEDMARTNWEGRWVRATNAQPIIQAMGAFRGWRQPDG